MLKHGEQAGIALTGAIWAMLENALFAAALGRLVWHCGLVLKGERAFFGREALMEVPVVLVGYIAGSALAAYLGLEAKPAQGLVLIVSYLGPNGFQAILNKYLSGASKH